MTDEGREKRSNSPICRPTKAIKLIISTPDIQAQISLTFSYFSPWKVLSSHRFLASYKFLFISYKILISLV